MKNERVQRFFNKSAQVASKWLDDQLNGEDKPKKVVKGDPRSDIKSDSKVRAPGTSDDSAAASGPAPAASAKN